MQHAAGVNRRIVKADPDARAQRIRHQDVRGIGRDLRVGDIDTMIFVLVMLILYGFM